MLFYCHCDPKQTIHPLLSVPTLGLLLSARGRPLKRKGICHNALESIGGRVAWYPERLLSGSGAGKLAGIRATLSLLHTAPKFTCS